MHGVYGAGRNKLEMYNEKFGKARVTQMLPTMTVSCVSMITDLSLPQVTK